MIKYLILFISGKFYFTSFNTKNQELQEFEPENNDELDLSLVLAEFCEKLTSNFEIYLFTDTVTLQSVDMSQQAPSANKSLLEQFLLFEIENAIDILPENPVLKFLKDNESFYHCLLTEDSVVNDLKNVCSQFGGKLAQLGHPAGFFSDLEKKNCVEVFENTVHCQNLNDKASFNLNSSLPTEYDSVQKWIFKRSLRNVSIFNFSGKDVIPLEGNILESKLSELNSKDLIKVFKHRLKSSPVLIFNKNKKNLKKQLPLIISLTISLILFSYLIIGNWSLISQLEVNIEKKKVSKQELESQKKGFEKKIDEIPTLEEKISKLKANEIIYQNVKFWPGLLENLANSFDEFSQLTKVTSEKDDTVTIQGITLDVLKIQKVLNSLESDENLRVAVLEKSVRKERINDNDLWNFTIKLVRNQ